MGNQTRSARYAVATAIIAALIVYGSLYPFAFRARGDVIAAVGALVNSWAHRPGRSDFIANTLDYAPFGLFAMLSLRRPRGGWQYLVVVIGGGGALSLSLELAQFFVRGRYTDANDVCANVLGTALGAIVAAMAGIALRVRGLDRAVAKPIPVMLLATWLAYELYPYVPTLDPQKYWEAIRPALMLRSLTAYDLFRQTVTWLMLLTLIEVIVGEQPARRLAPLFAGGAMVAEVMIIDNELSAAELSGAILAYFLWRPALAYDPRRRLWLLAVSLLSLIVCEQLYPFQFRPVAGKFAWLPFRSLMEGSLEDNTPTFLEAWFRYGSLLFVLGELGFRTYRSAILLSMLLLATNWAQIYQPGRSGEITDVVIALLVAAIIAALRGEPQLPVQPISSPCMPRAGHAGR